jgi:hypothetical protein
MTLLNVTYDSLNERGRGRQGGKTKRQGMVVVGRQAGWAVRRGAECGNAAITWWGERFFFLRRIK